MDIPADMFGAGGPRRVIGHRGAAGAAPENTLPAIHHATVAGADAVELDVHCARCGRLVVLHDANVDRTTDGSGPVTELSAAELGRLDAGFRFTPDAGRSFPFRGCGVRIPTLEEALDAANGLPLVIEVKSARAGEALAGWLAGHPERKRILVGGFASAAVLPAAAHARWRCASEDELRSWVLAAKLGLRRIGAGARMRLPAGVSALMLPARRRGMRVPTPRVVARAHEEGAGVFVWTVNRPPEMRRLLAAGVDGLISDYPAIARRVIDEDAARAIAGA